MRYQERIYEQTNTFARNKSVNIVNTSSDISVFYAPQFDISGATKVQCGDVQFTLSGFPYNSYLTAATNSCIGVNLPISCFTGSTWNTNIYTDNSLAYSGTFYTSNTITGVPTDNQFVQSVQDGFNSLGYQYTLSGYTFDLAKIYGVQNVKIDIDVFANYNYVAPFTCPSNYVTNPSNDGCQQVNVYTNGPSYNGSGSTIQSGSTDATYCRDGAYFYDDIANLGPYPLSYNPSGNLINSTGGTITALNISNGVQSNSFWYNSGNPTDGRLNKIGLSATTNSFVGFSKCLNILSGGTYYIGLAADNDAQFRLNGQLIVNLTGTTLQNFKRWSVFKVNLLSGQNIIEMLGENLDAGSASSFGAEVYYPTNYATLTGATTTGSTQANAIFSTSSYVGKTWDIGTNLGYSCPSGFALNTCATAYTCTQILRAPYSQICTGNCAGDEFQILSQDLPSINNASNGVYILDPTTGTTIPFTFNFTGNTNTFITNNATFNYEIYPFNPTLNLFTVPPIYSSSNISYSAFSGTNVLTQSINFSASSDGDYLVKGYTIGDAGTKYLNALGKKINTMDYVSSKTSNFYNPQVDFYFVAIYNADTPNFTQSQAQLIDNATTGSLALSQQVIIVGQNNNNYTNTGSTFTLTNTYNGQPIITLNGLVLASSYDYILSGQVLTFLGTILNGDVITVTYNTTNSIVLTSDSLYLNTTIPSGRTGNQGNNKYYYNTTTGKYEIYTQNVPVVGSTIMVILNGVTLVNNIDYYQSTTNPNRIILNGIIMKGDLIVIIYNPKASIVNGIYQNNNILNWSIAHGPMGNYGQFDIQYSSNITFTTYTTSSTIPYNTNVTAYSGVLSLTGNAGTNLYYRVKNTKSYPSKCGDPIVSVAYSETVPITILSNGLNSY